MLKRYIMILFIFIFFIKSYGQLRNTPLKNKYISSTTDLQDLTFNEVLAIISKDSNVLLVADKEVGEIVIDTYIPIEDNLEDILNTFAKIYGLKISKLDRGYIFTKDIKDKKTFSIYGEIKSKGYNYGVDGVQITVLNSNVPITYSKYGGKYIIPNIEPGIYMVKFEKKGYLMKGELVHLKEGETKLDIFLEKNNNISLNEILRSRDKNIIETTKFKDMENGKLVKVILNNINSKEMKTILEENFQGDLEIIETSKDDSLILKGNHEELLLAKEFIKEVDKEREQVLVNTQIIDVSNNIFESLGFNWIYGNNLKKEGEHKTDLGISIFNGSSIMGIGNVYNSTINVTRQFSNAGDVLNFGINMLEGTQDLVVNARPSLVIIDGEEGEFKVTEEVIVGEKKDENKDNEKTTSTPIFKEAGIIMKVIPHIKEDDTVVLDIDMEVSNFKLNYMKDGKETSGTYNSEGGSKIGRRMKTKIKIKNGETIFIGGLKKAIIHNDDSRVPILGTLPMINFFFKNRNVSHETTDIYIKLKVDIVKNNVNILGNNDIIDGVKKITENKIY